MCDVETTIDVPSFGANLSMQQHIANQTGGQPNQYGKLLPSGAGQVPVYFITKPASIDVSFSGGEYLLTDLYREDIGAQATWPSWPTIGGCPPRGVPRGEQVFNAQYGQVGFYSQFNDYSGWGQFVPFSQIIAESKEDILYSPEVNGPQKTMNKSIWGWTDFLLGEDTDAEGELITVLYLKVYIFAIRVVSSYFPASYDDVDFSGPIPQWREQYYTITKRIYRYVTTDNIFDFDPDDDETVSACERSTTATLVGSGDLVYGSEGETYQDANSVIATDFVPSSIQITTKFNDERNGLEGVVGADAGDRGNATWRLEYNIQEQLWTLRSFERIQNPIYTLVDSNPCEGLSKTLTRVQNIGVSGCEVSPETVEITRGCPAQLSFRPRDPRVRPPPEQRQCVRNSEHKGCDCKDMPIDERWRSLSRCVDITTPGCEDYGDDVECFFPKNQLTCADCGDSEIPCTYEALFGAGIVGETGRCDIVYEGTGIASSTVTLRQRCRFEGPCEWVAVGPTGDKRDGVVGREPYCMLCSDFAVGSCASNCTWEAVQAGLCPASGKPGQLNPPINILAKWGTSWHLEVVGGVGGMIGDLAHLYYNHPSFGMLRYRVSPLEPFLCDNVNTMYLEERGDLPEGVMPKSICVRPRYSGCGGAMDYDIKSDAYDTVEHQIACCDPACGSIGPIPIRIMCCNRLEQCETTFVAQTTLLGIEDPAGPSYLGSCTLHGVLWTGVHYCDGNRWLADWYCGSPRVFFTTTVHTHDCCPLTISVEPFPENFGGVTCCPQADCTCNLRDDVTLTFTIVEPGATTASNCGPNPADCSDAGFNAPISIVLTRVGATAKYVGEACFLGGLPFEFELTCGHDGINDTDAPVGDYQLLIFPPPAFSTCLNTPELRYSEMQQNKVSAPAILLEFDDYFCGDDHADVDCQVFTDITITG